MVEVVVTQIDELRREPPLLDPIDRRIVPPGPPVARPGEPGIHQQVDIIGLDVQTSVTNQREFHGAR